MKRFPVGNGEVTPGTGAPLSEARPDNLLSYSLAQRVGPGNQLAGKFSRFRIRDRP